MFKMIITNDVDDKTLIYRKFEYSVDTIPMMNADITVLVADLYIGFDSQTTYCNQIFGYLPQFLFAEEGFFTVPTAPRGILALDTACLAINSGETIRLADSEQWISLRSAETRHVYFGKETLSQEIQCLELYPNCVVALNLQGELEALWLSIQLVD